MRYTLLDDPDFSSNELVGVLMAVTSEEHITVVDRRGNTHEIASASIQALKVFPA